MNRYYVAVFAWLAVACGDPASTPELPTGELIGRVEIAPDVPTAACMVLLEGSPLGARCDGAGAFDIQGVLPGRWDLRIVADASTALPSRRVAAASNPGFVTDLGAIRLAEPGSIGGHIIGATDGIVAVPAFGLVSAPNANGGYLIEGVPPGIHEVAFITDAGTVTRGGVSVAPGKTTIKIDLDASTAIGGQSEIDGRALRAHATSDGNGGLTVELIDAATGEVVTSTTSAADGAFVLITNPGIFVVRARDGDSPITAVIPSVVPHGPLPLVLTSPLVVFPFGDLDHDGISDDADPDADNDGVPNEIDAFPFDPAESQDIDGDGLGDRADIATHGTDLDTHTMTPDTDGDGLLDFEDICKLVADPGQVDSDGDGVGNACDNCPLIPNADQADSVGNGVGNACRSCNGNEACPIGQTCQQGACVECTSSAQCNGEVCVNGGCAPCSTTQACDAGLCNLPVGLCQECLVNLDCGAGSGCVAGHCFAGCNTNPDCGGAAFCVGHVCAECRGNADCPSTQYCDNGLCQPECSVNANCSGGRICELSTRTCQLPCGTGCPTGQSCVQPGNLCRASCDLTFPCPGGQICTAGTCGPACTFDTDCGALEACQLGECVPSGACNLDTDCPASQMCGGMFNACIARPTAFDPAAGEFTCSTACDCKLGETCNAGHCDADPIPTRFVAQGAGGNGLSINSPTGSLQVAMTNLVDGDTVAILNTSTLQVTGAPVTPTGSNLSIQGGYTACNATRWVRDPVQPSQVHETQTSQILLSLGKNFAVPTTNALVRGLRLSGANGDTLVDASFTPNITIDDVALDLDGAVNIDGISVKSSSGVTISNITMPTYNLFSTLDVIRLDTSAGTIRNISFGTVTGIVAANGIHVVAATGPVTIDNVSMGLWSYFNETQVILIDATPLTTVSVTNAHFKGVTSLGNGPWSGVHVKNSAAVAVSDSTLDSTGFLDPATSANGAHYNTVWFENSAGTIDRVTVDLPQTTSIGIVSPFYILGPQGAVTISDCTVTGRGGPTTRMINIEDVTNSTPVIQRGTFSSIQTGTVHTSGLFADNSKFVMTDSSFVLPGTALEVFGFELVAAANGRIERSRFRAGGVATVTDHSVGGHVTGDSSVELYGNWLVGGGPTKLFSAGLWLDTDYNVRAIGNTIEAGGLAGQPGDSDGVLCEPAANQGAALFSSNIVDGGLAANHFMVHATATTNSCSLASNWDHAYFAFRSGGSRDATAFEVADDIAAASATSLIKDAVTCFASNDPTTGFLLANGALCIDAGVAGTRLDATPIVKDIQGNARVIGGTADIGAHEK